MIITKMNYLGHIPIFKLSSLPIQKVALRPFLDLSSLSRGLKGVRRVDEKSPQISSQKVIYF